MKFRLHIYKFLCVLLLFILLYPNFNSMAAIRKIEYREWKDCYEISNNKIKVIINGTSGGRIMALGRYGSNIIWEDSTIDGKLYKDFLKDTFHVDAGRFDLGPEKITDPIHAKPWAGYWDAKIIDDFTLELSCLDEYGLGLELIRRFTLSTDSSKISIYQSMKNISDEEKSYWFWNRTLLKVGGIAFSPVHPNSKFPDKWNRYIWGDKIQIVSDPNDDGVQIKDSLFVLNSKLAENSKYGTDGAGGWMAYYYKDILFLKRFPHYANKLYGEDGGHTNIYYVSNKGEKQFIEIEPVSPVYKMQPAEKAEFEQEWLLLDIGENIQLKDLVSKIKHEL